jgi:hypothetical protein
MSPVTDLNPAQQRALDEFREQHGVEVVTIDRINVDLPGEPDILVRLTDGWPLTIHHDGTGSGERLTLPGQ